MGRWVCFGFLLSSVILGGCGGVEYREVRNKHVKSRSPLLKSAVRVELTGDLQTCGAEQIGVIAVTDLPAATIPILAEEVADEGGTHYRVTYDSSNAEYSTAGYVEGLGRVDLHHSEYRRSRRRRVAAVVYRLPPEGWECAGFSGGVVVP